MVAGGFIAVGADLTFGRGVEGVAGGSRNFLTGSVDTGGGVGGITMLPFRPAGLDDKGEGLIFEMILIPGGGMGGGVSTTGVGGRVISTFGRGSS